MAHLIRTFDGLSALTHHHVTLSNQEQFMTDAKAYEAYFESVLKSHHAMISRVCASYEMKKALQEELYQEISFALWKALSRFDGQSSLKTYVLSIAHKRAVSHVAKNVKEPTAIDLEQVEIGGVDCPSETLKQQQQMEKLTRSLRLLPLVDRQLVTLALEGVSYQDIAEILGLTVTNVGVKLNRAKQKLGQLMAEVGGQL